MLTQGTVHIQEDDALGLEVLTIAVVHDLGLILGGHPGQVLALGLWDPQLLVGVLDRLGDVVPVVRELPGRLDVVVDVVEVDTVEVTAPGWHRPAGEPLVRLQPEIQHPLRFVLHRGNGADHVIVEALFGLVGVVLLVTPAELVAAEIYADLGG